MGQKKDGEKNEKKGVFFFFFNVAVEMNRMGKIMYQTLLAFGEKK